MASSEPGTVRDGATDAAGALGRAPTAPPVALLRLSALVGTTAALVGRSVISRRT